MSNKCYNCNMPSKYNLCKNCEEYMLHHFYKDYMEGFRLGDIGYISVSNSRPILIEFVGYNEKQLNDVYKLIKIREANHNNTGFIEMEDVDVKNFMIWKGSNSNFTKKIRYKRLPIDIIKCDKEIEITNILKDNNFKYMLDFMSKNILNVTNKTDYYVQGSQDMLCKTIKEFLKSPEIIQSNIAGINVIIKDKKLLIDWKYDSRYEGDINE